MNSNHLVPNHVEHSPGVALIVLCREKELGTRQFPVQAKGYILCQTGKRVYLGKSQWQEQYMEGTVKKRGLVSSWDTLVPSYAFSSWHRLYFLAGESFWYRGAGKGKTTTTSLEDSHPYGPKRGWLLFSHPWPWSVHCESVPGGAACGSPSDLILLTGKVLAATTRAVDPAICCRRRVARPSWHTGWWPAGPLSREEDLQVQHRWPQEAVAVGWIILLGQWVVPVSMGCNGPSSHMAQVRSFVNQVECYQRTKHDCSPSFCDPKTWRLLRWTIGLTIRLP